MYKARSGTRNTDIIIIQKFISNLKSISWKSNFKILNTNQRND